MTRILRFLLLCLTLLATQQALVAHGIEHSFHDHGESCIECLALPGMQAVPPRPPQVFLPAAGRFREVPAVPPAPTFARALPFRSRAPPPAQSR